MELMIEHLTIDWTVRGIRTQRPAKQIECCRRDIGLGQRLSDVWIIG
jgi:hypothetical protein